MNLMNLFRIFLDVAYKYYLLAGVAFLIYYIFLRKKISWKKIQAGFPKNKDYRREIFYSTLSILIFTVPPVLIVNSYRLRLHSTWYQGAGRYGWVYFFAAVPLMMLIHDTFFYWVHRLLHHPRLFRIFHLVHHQSINPSPWAAYSFHPLEAMVESLIFFIFLYTIPIHSAHLFVFFLISLAYNVYGHLGFELFPVWFNQHWLGKWLNNSVSHNMHHRYARGNYGLYFTFWDRIMGTLNKDYNEAYAEVTEREKPAGLPGVE